MVHVESLNEISTRLYQVRLCFVSILVPQLRYTPLVAGQTGLSGAKNEMRAHSMTAAQSRRIVAGLPFVEALARRMASTMPHSIDVGDLVQDGVIGLIDAAHRFDEGRGIKFETFAERRIRGAMIDALRRDAWPRGVRRVRRELEAARETLRRELGHEPSLSDLAAKVGTDEKRLGRTIVRPRRASSDPMRAARSASDGSAPSSRRSCSRAASS